MAGREGGREGATDVSSWYVQSERGRGMEREREREGEGEGRSSTQIKEERNGKDETHTYIHTLHQREELITSTHTPTSTP